MRILFTHRPGGAYAYISDGWINAVRSAGHVAERWDGRPGTWNDFLPDLYVGCSGHRQDVPANRGSTKVAVHVNPYGPIAINGINESADSIKWVQSIKPDCVFGYGWDSDAILWSHWKAKAGIPWVPMPTAADVTVYKPLRTERPFDLVYLGGRWAYKAMTIDKYLLPALEGLKWKLHGWGDWPAGVCSGKLPDDAANAFLNSGAVGPCISEMHTHTHGLDIPERAFKVACVGTLVVHDSISIRNMMPSAVVAATPDEYRDSIRRYAADRQACHELAERQRKEVLAGHTYHHRMFRLMSSLGFDDEASKVASALEELIIRDHS